MAINLTHAYAHVSRIKKRKQHLVGLLPGPPVMSGNSCFDVLMWMACLTRVIMPSLQLVRVFLLMSAWHSMLRIKQIYANFLLMFSAYFICSYGEILLKSLTVRTLYKTGSHYALGCKENSACIQLQKIFLRYFFKQFHMKAFSPRKTFC